MNYSSNFRVEFYLLKIICNDSNFTILQVCQYNLSLISEDLILGF